LSKSVFSQRSCIFSVQYFDITIDNACPGCGVPDVFITTPLDGATVSGSMPFETISTDDINVSQVTLRITGPSVDVSHACATSGKSVTCNWPAGGWDSSVAEKGTYVLSAVANDGSVVGRAEISVEVNNADLLPPVVSIDTPADGSTVQFDASVTATATDNVDRKSVV